MLARMSVAKLALPMAGRHMYGCQQSVPGFKNPCMLHVMSIATHKATATCTGGCHAQIQTLLKTEDV